MRSRLDLGMLGSTSGRRWPALLILGAGLLFAGPSRADDPVAHFTATPDAGTVDEFTRINMDASASRGCNNAPISTDNYIWEFQPPYAGGWNPIQFTDVVRPHIYALINWQPYYYPGQPNPSAMALRLAVRDPACGKTSPYIYKYWNITNINRKPDSSVIGPNPLVVNEGDVAYVETGWNDPDGDPIRQFIWEKTSGGPALWYTDNPRALWLPPYYPYRRLVFHAPYIHSGGDKTYTYTVKVDDFFHTWSDPAPITIIVRNGPQTGNDAPVLPDIYVQVDEGAEAVINYAGAVDPNEDYPLSYQWDDPTGDPHITWISGGDTAQPRFRAPYVSGGHGTTLYAGVTVTDSLGLSSPGYATIFVRNTTSGNSPPSVSAAAPLSPVVEGTANVPLVATANDSDGIVTGYQWRQTAGPAVTLTGATAQTAHFTAPIVDADSTLTFGVKAMDDDGAWSNEATVNVVVQQGIAPVATANTNTPTVDEGQTGVTLLGSGTDADGTIVAYEWTQISGPPAALSNPTAQNPTFRAPYVLASEDAVFGLRVRDNHQNWSAVANVTVRVTDQRAGNNPPSANAGAGRTVGEATTVTLLGSGTDSDGRVVNYEWTQVSGPAATWLTTPNRSDPQLRMPSVRSQTDLVFSLRVQDDDEAWSTNDARVTITVQNTVNDPPTANAGMDVEVQNIAVGLIDGSYQSVPSVMVLDGSRSVDLDGPIVTYEWTQTAGVSVFWTGNRNQAHPKFTVPLSQEPYSFQFQLVVVDNIGQRSAPDTVVVNVTGSRKHCAWDVASSNASILGPNPEYVQGPGGRFTVSADRTLITSEPPRRGRVTLTTPAATAVAIDTLFDFPNVISNPRVRMVVWPNRGTASIAPNGLSIQYTPNPDFQGTDSLAFSVENPSNEFERGVMIATLRVGNTGSNAPPAIADQNLTATYYVPLDFSLSATDPDSDPIHVFHNRPPETFQNGVLNVRSTPADLTYAQPYRFVGDAVFVASARETTDRGQQSLAFVWIHTAMPEVKIEARFGTDAQIGELVGIQYGTGQKLFTFPSNNNVDILHPLLIWVTFFQERFVLLRHQVYVDNFAPTVRWVTDPAGGCWRDSVTFEVFAEDPTGMGGWPPARVMLYPPTGDPLEMPYINAVGGYRFRLPYDTQAMGAGPHTFSVRSFDRAGRESAPISTSVRLDRNGPDITFVQPRDGDTVTDIDLPLRVRAQDGCQVASVRTWVPVGESEFFEQLHTVTPADDVTVTSPWTKTNLQWADYALRAQATDIFGNASPIEEITISYRGNRRPVARVVTPVIVNERQPVTLDGTGSFDPDNDPIRYVWRKVSGTPDITLTGGDTATPSFTAPAVTQNETVQFGLVVVDDEDFPSLAAVVDITIQDLNGNEPPINVSAGPDRFVNEGDTGDLLGLGEDPEGFPLTWLWEQVPPINFSVTLSNPTAQDTSFLAPQVTYNPLDPTSTQLRVRLTATDAQSASTADDAVITVNDSPVANAGPDQPQVLASQLIQLNGSASYDPERQDLPDQRLRYLWEQTEGVVVELSDPRAASPTFIAPDVSPTVNRMVFRLWVKDEHGAISDTSDEVEITVQNGQVCSGHTPVPALTRFLSPADMAPISGNAQPIEGESLPGDEGGMRDIAVIVTRQINEGDTLDIPFINPIGIETYTSTRRYIEAAHAQDPFEFSPNIRYTPVAGFRGRDAFAYRVENGQCAASVTVIISVEVGSRDKKTLPPVAFSQKEIAPSDADSVTFNLDGEDINGDDVTVAVYEPSLTQPPAVPVGAALPAPYVYNPSGAIQSALIIYELTSPNAPEHRTLSAVRVMVSPAITTHLYYYLNPFNQERAEVLPPFSGFGRNTWTVDTSALEERIYRFELETSGGYPPPGRDVRQFLVDRTQIAITSPPDGATVGPTFTMRVDVQDPNPLNRVALYIDQTVSPFATFDLVDPGQFSALTPVLPLGSHTLYAVAKDNNNQDTWATPVTVEVGNVPGELAVNAGEDQTIRLPAAAILMGTVTNGIPQALTTQWSAVSTPLGAVVTFSREDQLNTLADFSMPGAYTLRLTADDTQSTAFDEINIVVMPDLLGNDPPFVFAGFDQSVQLPAAAILDGEVRDDNMAEVTVAWSLVSGPGAVTFRDMDKIDTVADFSTDGVYVLRLTARDSVHVRSDDIEITVTPDPPGNDAPFVFAGFDQTVRLPGLAVLDAEVRDDNMSLVTTRWEKLTGPGEVTFFNPNAVDTLASIDVPGEYELKLTADDNSGQFVVSDVVRIIVEPDGPGNDPPFVFAGWDQRIRYPAAAVLDGEVRDDDMTLVTTRWTVESGPAGVSFKNPAAVDTLADFDAPGNYVLVLTADDNNGEHIVSDRVRVRVDPDNPGNDKPFVFAGFDQTVRLPGLAILDGEMRDDNPGLVVISWVQAAGPAAAVIRDAAAIDTLAEFPQAGTYEFDLIANDDNGVHVVSDRARVTVLDDGPGNDAPFVFAGFDQTIRLPAAAVLDAEMRDDNPALVTVSWTQTGGTGQAIIKDPASVDTLVDFSQPGTYELTLTANDNNGEHVVSDAIQIVVLGDGPGNDPPFVFAGFDQDIQLPGAAVLDGEIRDDDLSLVTAQWSTVSGPGAVTFRNATAIDTLADFGAPGVYVLKLTANDNNGQHIVEDRIQITVRADGPGNDAPWVFAGFDQTVRLPGLGVLLGEMRDDNPSLVTTRWSMAQGPAPVVFRNDASLETLVDFSQPGVYVLTLTADDNNGEFIRSDTITMTVLPDLPGNDAPFVHAGFDQAVRMPGLAILDADVRDDNLSAVVTQWTIDQGPAPVTFRDPAAVDTLAEFTLPGLYRLKLTANDNNGEHIVSDIVEVTVTPDGPGNDAPFVFAGFDQDVLLPGGAILDAEVRDDNMSLVATLWSVEEGPGAVTFRDVSSVDTLADFSQPGLYRLKLTANDNNGEHVVFDIVDVRVSADGPGNDKPFVYAGPDQSVRLPGLAILDGEVRDDDMSLVVTQWNVESGPGAVTFREASAVDTLAEFSAPGEYVLTLTAIDNGSGQTVSDRVRISVSPDGPGNDSPFVFAGFDQDVMLPGGAILDAEVRDDNMSLVTTLWSLDSGPGAVTFRDATAIDTLADFSVPGLYRLKLTANDNNGEHIVFDIVDIRVSDDGPGNDRPFVYAGPDQTVRLPGLAILDGEVRDDNLSLVSINWSLESGPAAVTFLDSNAVDTLAEFGQPGVYVLKLTANDSGGMHVVSDRVTVTVLSDGPGNDAPFVFAGFDQDIMLPGGAILDAEVRDDNLSLVTTLWSLDSGPGAVTFRDAAAVDTLADFSQPGLYRLKLTANDNNGEHVVSDIVEINVLADGPGNDRPFVYAGEDQTIQWPAGALMNGVVRDDNLALVTIQWIQESGSGVAVFRDAARVDTLVEFTDPGDYILRLTANDNNGEHIVFDRVSIRVLPDGSGNDRPFVYAGEDQVVTQFVGASIDGVVRDDNMSLVALSWSKVSGPGLATFSAPAEEDTDVAFDQLGVYVLRLTANDNNGQHVVMDDVTIDVVEDAPGNDRPIVDAGDNQTVSLPLPAVLQGTLRDDHPELVALIWTLDAGPAPVTFDNPAALSTPARFTMAGQYIFRLTANDNNGEHVVEDTTSVLVLETGENQPPQVIMPPDQQVQLPANAILDATVIDERPEQLVLLWTQEEGPGTVVFNQPTSVDTLATFTLPGSYRLRLTADDGEFVRFGDVNVLVISDPAGNDAPIVFAGFDQSITLPGFAILDADVWDDDLSLVTTLWSVLQGPGGVTFRNPAAIDTIADFSQPGLYVLKLTANDNNGQHIISDTVEITVSDDHPGNDAPTVWAGPDRVIELSEPTQLDGEVRDDNLPLVTLRWSLVTGPGSVSFTTDQSADTQATFSETGLYVLRLTANDNNGEHIVSDDVEVDVRPDSNLPPSVEAGENQTVRWPSFAIVRGTLNDDNPALVVTTWSQDSGAGASTVRDPNQLETIIDFSIPGLYGMTLTANDNNGEHIVPDGLEINVLPDGPDNDPPAVFAGFDRTIQLPGFAVLDGEIRDDNPALVAVQWTLELGPASAAIRNPAAIDTVADFTEPGTYVFRLTANDNNGEHVVSDTVQFIVEADGPGNDAPTVYAGLDLIVDLPNTAALLGELRDDNPGLVSVRWTAVQGPAPVTIDNDSTLSATAHFTQTGLYRFRLTANDNNGEHIVFDEAVVAVRSASSGNQPPAVNAGADQSIQSPALAILDGDIQDDNLILVTAQWSVVQGPGTVAFANASAIDTTAEFSVPGNYRLRLTADDNNGEYVISDEVDITVNPDGPGNDPPFVFAGFDQNVVLPGAAILDAEVRDDNLSLVTTLWTRESGPGAVTFQNASAIDTLADFSAAGVYVLKLTANDNSGEHIVSDTIQVTVSADGPGNDPPFVFAGFDQNVMLPGAAILDAEVRDDNLSLVTTLWTKESGPGAVTFQNALAIDTSAQFTLPGLYRLRLTANDNNGEHIVSDLVDIIVGPAVNLAPRVNAGADQTMSLPSGAILDATVEDDNLALVTTVWSVEEGPAAVTFRDPAAVDTVADFAAAGLYRLKLTATDNGGEHVVSDIVEITVNPDGPGNDAPFVFAGFDQSVTLPGAAVLDGEVRDDNLSLVTTQWTVESGPGVVTFQNAAAVDTLADFSAAGVYRLVLTANDNNGEHIVSDTVEITVAEDGPGNDKPFVFAGFDQAILMPRLAQLDGEVRDDDLALIALTWSQDSGPGPAAIANASAIDTLASFTQPGDYVFRLTANDNNGEHIVFDTVRVSVVADNPGNDAPFVFAGFDQEIPMEGPAALAGELRDDNPALVVTGWTVTSGPGSVVITDPSSLATSATFGAPGHYVLRLTANDNNGEFVVFDEVDIEITQGGGNPPTLIGHPDRRAFTVTAEEARIFVSIENGTFDPAYLSEIGNDAIVVNVRKNGVTSRLEGAVLLSSDRIIFDGDVPSNSEVTWSVDLKDTDGNRYQETFDFIRAMPQSEGGRASRSGLHLDIGPGALPEDLLVLIELMERPEWPQGQGEPDARLRMEPVAIYGLNRARERIWNLAGSAHLSYVEPPQELPPDEVARFLQINMYDDAAQDWIAIASGARGRGVAIRAGERTVEGDVRRFGVYRIVSMAAPGDGIQNLLFYPNPYDPTEGVQTFQYELGDDAEVTLTIYDLIGNLVLVRKIAPGDEGARFGFNTITWDGRNGVGVMVGNGGYILLMHAKNVNGGESRVREKLGVVK